MMATSHQPPKKDPLLQGVLEALEEDFDDDDGNNARNMAAEDTSQVFEEALEEPATGASKDNNRRHSLGNSPFLLNGSNTTPSMTSSSSLTVTPILSSSGMGLKQREKILDDLKKENFGLKMRIYYLNDNLAKLSLAVAETSPGAILNRSDNTPLSARQTAAQFTSWAEDNVALRSETESLHEEIKTYQAELEAASKHIAQQEELISKLTAQLNSPEYRFNLSTIKEASSSSDLELHAESDSSASQARNGSSNNATTSSSQEFQEANEGILIDQSAYQELQKKLKNAEQWLERYEKGREEAQALQTSLNEQIAGLEEKLARAEDWIRGYEQDRDSSMNSMREEYIAKFDAEIAAYQEQHEAALSAAAADRDEAIELTKAEYADRMSQELSALRHKHANQMSQQKEAYERQIQEAVDAVRQEMNLQARQILDRKIVMEPSVDIPKIIKSNSSCQTNSAEPESVALLRAAQMEIIELKLKLDEAKTHAAEKVSVQRFGTPDVFTAEDQMANMSMRSDVSSFSPIAKLRKELYENHHDLQVLADELKQETHTSLEALNNAAASNGAAQASGQSQLDSFLAAETETLKTLSETHALLDDDFVRLQGKTKEMESMVIHRSHELEEKSRQVEELRNALEETQVQYSSLQDKYHHVRELNVQLKSKHDALKDRVSGLEHERTNLLMNMERSASSVATLSSNMERLDAQLQAIQTMNASLSREKEELVREKQTWLSTDSTSVSKIENLQKLHDAAIQFYVQRADELSAEITTLRSKESELTTKISAAIQEKCDQTIAHKNELNAESSAKDHALQQLSQANTKISTQKTYIRELQEKVNAFASKCSQYKSVVKTTNQEMEFLKESLDKQTAHLSDLEANIKLSGIQCLAGQEQNSINILAFLVSLIKRLEEIGDGLGVLKTPSQPMDTIPQAMMVVEGHATALLRYKEAFEVKLEAMNSLLNEESKRWASLFAAKTVRILEFESKAKEAVSVQTTLMETIQGLKQELALYEYKQKNGIVNSAGISAHGDGADAKSGGGIPPHAMKRIKELEEMLKEARSIHSTERRGAEARVAELMSEKRVLERDLESLGRKYRGLEEMRTNLRSASPSDETRRIVRHNEKLRKQMEDQSVRFEKLEESYKSLQTQYAKMAGEQYRALSKARPSSSTRRSDAKGSATARLAAALPA